MTATHTAGIWMKRNAKISWIEIYLRDWISLFMFLRESVTKGFVSIPFSLIFLDLGSQLLFLSRK